MTFWVYLVQQRSPCWPRRPPAGKNWDGVLIEVAWYFWQQLANRPMTQHARLFASAETLALESVDWLEDRIFVFFPPPSSRTAPRCNLPDHFGSELDHETLDWQPDERVVYRSFCLPSQPRHVYGEIPNGEVKSMASYVGLCQSQILAGKGTITGARRLESSGARRECILFAALDGAAPSLVFRCQVRWPSEVWHCLARAEKTSASTILLSIIAGGCLTICVISSFEIVSLHAAHTFFFPTVCLEWCFNARRSHNLKRNIVVEVNGCLFNSITPVALWKLCAGWTFSDSGWILFMDQFRKWNILLICRGLPHCVQSIKMSLQ